jgi:hypothetical protein
MKRLFILIFVGLYAYNLTAQQAPTGTAPANNTTAQALAAWYRGGNIQNGSSNNIFGTLWDSPIYTQTDGALRMKLNGTTANYTVNGIPGIAATNSKAGFLLVGPNFGGIYTLRGAYSRFHVTGTNPTQFGYRPWMETGVTFTDNDDLSYFGLRKVG